MRAAPAKSSQPFQFQLDLQSGVPVYRQIIDQVLGGISAGNLKPGDQLPTVRQLAVDLSINPNTVVRAYRELEIREILSTQQGTGTFITEKTVKTNEIEHQRQLAQLANDFLARAGAAGITLQELLDYLSELKTDRDRRV
jgi:DNA-binding transcriptional regulator YhcF (GntR family)